MLGDLLPLLHRRPAGRAERHADRARRPRCTTAATSSAGRWSNFDKYLKISTRTRAAGRRPREARPGRARVQRPRAGHLLHPAEPGDVGPHDHREAADQFDSLLTTGTSTSRLLQSFLSDNEQRLIAVTGQTVKIYSLLDEYSPEFTLPVDRHQQPGRPGEHGDLRQPDPPRASRSTSSTSGPYEEPAGNGSPSAACTGLRARTASACPATRSPPTPRPLPDPGQVPLPQ